MNETSLTVEAQFLSHEWDEAKPFRDNLAAAMRQARKGGHMGWLSREEDQFKAACAVGLLKGTDEDRAWLRSQIEGLRKFLAVGVDELAASLSEVPRVDREYRLLDLWQGTAERTP